MKGKFTKIMAALALLVGLTIPMGMWGQTSTASFAPSDFSGQGTSGTGSAISATVDGVTFACDKGFGTTQIRCYSGGVITISSSNTITAISFTFSGSYTGGMETSYTNLSTTSWTKTLSSQARITACTVTYSTGGTPNAATPTFSPAGGTYAQAKNVAINCATENATIYYTTNGDDPTTSSDVYSSPITIIETTTLKAMAAATGYGNSAVASATYTITTPSTIAEVRAQGSGDVFTQGIVTSCVGTTGYIQDNTAAICVYGTSLAIGDAISVSGTLTTYNGLLEITNPVVDVISSGNTINPELMTIAQVNASDNQGWYVRIEDATVTAISGSGNSQNTPLLKATILLLCTATLELLLL